MKVVVKKIDGKKLALISAICTGLLSLIFIPVFLLMNSINHVEMPSWFKVLIILVPIIYFVMGYILTRLSVGVFNIIVKRLKGFDIEIEDNNCECKN